MKLKWVVLPSLQHRQPKPKWVVLQAGESLVLQVDETTAEVYAQVRDELRQNGRPIPENDLWIAALARQHRQPVVSRDGHFDDVPGLRRLSW